jgi:hypothetical protein
MPGVTGVTVVTNARVYYTTRAAAGASGARHSLRPLISEGGTCRIKLALTGGEIAKLRPRRMPLFEIEIGVHTSTLVMPGLDPGIHPSSQEVLSKKMDCRVKPGNHVLTVFAPTRWLAMMEHRILIRRPSESRDP